MPDSLINSQLIELARISVDESLRGANLREYHGGQRAGHLSPLKTWQGLRERVFWPGLHADVYRHVKACGVCQSRTNLVGGGPAATETADPGTCTQRCPR